MNINGLTKQQVNERIEKGLQNKSSKTRSKKTTDILVENIFSVFNIIIFSLVLFLLIFYFRTNDQRLILDSIGVSMIAIVNTLIAVIQEIRAKRALDKVSLLLKKEVTVIRDGGEITIDQSEIVVDDVICLRRGEQVVVDGRIIEANHMEIDESLLTGESHPIEKKSGDTVLSGSFCVSGNGYYTAEKVGDESYASEITRIAKRFKFGLSPLQIRINFLVKLLFSSAIVLIILEALFQGISFGYVESVRKVSTIMLSLIPQGLVLMASVTFALGIYRISKIGAIIQKLNAIESFSNIKVVCTDKTGTLTQNKLSVRKITLLNESRTEEEIKTLLGTYAKFSSDKNATLRTLEGFQPIAGSKADDEKPFSSELKYSMLKLNINSKPESFILGAYDILIEKTPPASKQKAENLFSSEDLRVYRNLLFGLISETDFSEISEDLTGVEIKPLCIISITDIARDDVMDAIELFSRNDIEVKILSGDSAAAIQAVAKDIGWNINDNELISGKQIDEIPDESFTAAVKEKKIFARLKPEHKLRIIKTLKKEKIYTAMIGDGVNDLPAIKEADMGIAMEEGSQITKEVADIVLLKNKFSLLPQIFDEGNKIVNTVSSVAKLFLTKNFMVIYLTLISLFFLFEFPLTPRRVALINLFSIGLPSLIIAIKNANVSKSKKFMEDLISFVLISSGVIVGAALLGEYFAEKYFAVNKTDLEMIMMSIMIMTTTANYLSVALHKGEKNIKTYLSYGLLIVGLFIFFAVVDIDFILFNLIKTFYEITPLKTEYWGLVAVISVIGAAVLYMLQLLRERVFFRKTVNRK
jgi:cation-transporting P-type ATPase E